MKFLRSALLTVLAIGLVATALPASAQLQLLPITSSREFSPPPPVGVHPRVLFSPQDWPALKERLLTTQSGKVMLDMAQKDVDSHREIMTELGALTPDAVDAAAVTKYWKADERRNPAFLSAAILGLTHGDPAMKSLAINAIVGYSLVILKARDLDTQAVISPLHTSTGGSTDFWGSHYWDVGSGWQNGDIGLALTYDFLYNDMSTDQQDTVRKAISAVTSGRRSFGMDQPSGRIMTNWALYHGHLPVMALAIEGEPGYDPQIYSIWVGMVKNYLNQAIYDGGAASEDSYPLGTSLRDSASLMVAMAKRGTNYFTDPHYQQYWQYVAQSLEPFDNGGFIGHAAGGTLGYAGSWAVAHYALPTSPLINNLWRWYAGEDYKKHLSPQSVPELLLFGTDWNPSIPGSTDRGNLGLPKNAFYPGRGLQITRSDWGQNALVMHFDARADAFLIGHDNVDRGTFTITALGKTWAPDLDWQGFKYGDEHSLVQIDGKSEPWKAPSVKFLFEKDQGDAVLSAADLSYAYDWQWPSPWPSMTQTFPAPWEVEKSDPRALGLPDTAQFAWIPHQLYNQPDVGFAGMNFWREPYNPVQRAFRSMLFARGKHPYVLVVDDIRKDDSAHQYDWLLQLANDVVIKSQNGDDIVLGTNDEADQRRLLVRLIPPPTGWGDALPTAHLDSYLGRDVPGKGADIGKHLPGTRLVVTRAGAVQPDFKIMILPYSVGTPLPKTTWSPDGKSIIQSWPDENNRIALTLEPGGRSDISYSATQR